MRKLYILIAALTTACTNYTPSTSALCDATRAQRAEVAADVAQTADDRLAVSAAGLVVILDAGCE